MVIILDEIREMISMQGGDASTVNDISEGLVTLKRLMKENQAPKKEVKPVEVKEEVAAPVVGDSEEEYVPRKTRKK